MPCPLEIINVLGPHFGYHVFIELFHYAPLTYYKHNYIFISILVFVCMCVSPLPKDSKDLSLGCDEYSIYSFYLHVLPSF